MNKERDEQVIFIKDLIFSILYRWRKILIAAIVVAVLMGGLSAVLGLIGGNSDASSNSALRDSARSQAEYLENSVLMNIDPHHVGKATANVSILAETFSAEGSNELTSYIGALLNGYSTAITNCLGTEEAAQALELTTADLLELVTVSTAIHGPADGTLSVYAYHSDLEKAEQIIEYILEKLPATTEMLKDSVANHTTSTVTASGIRPDLTLLERQTKALKTLDDMRTALDRLPAEETGITFSLKGILLNAIIGAFLGGCLAVGVILVSHFSSTKVYSARTLTAWTGIKVLSCAEGTRPKGAIDRWLRKLEGRAEETALPVAATIAANYAVENADFLICADPACPEAVHKALVQKIPTAKLCGTVMEDISAVEALPGCGAVLLVAVCGKTRYSDISRQMQLIHDQNKPLVGCIVIDG